ncbi:MAG: phosphatase PAP2 family protein [Janthinobacterium lividum]
MGARAEWMLTATRAGLVRLSDREIDWVERALAAARRQRLNRAVIAVSWLGNGTIYVVLALLLLGFVGGTAWRVIAVGALCGGVSHIVYPVIKRAGGRPRPYRHRTSLVPLDVPLDYHSFPSGHAMSLSATLTPGLFAWPNLWPVAMGLWLAMAWSRIASGHHYPSDVLGGTLLGSAIALPLTRALL